MTKTKEFEIIEHKRKSIRHLTVLFEGERLNIAVKDTEIINRYNLISSLPQQYKKDGCLDCDGKNTNCNLYVGKKSDK